MKLPRRELAELVGKWALDGRLGPGAVKSLADYLLCTGRINELASLLRDVQRIRADHGYLEVVVTSARPLSATNLRQARVFAKRLYPAARHITVNERRDLSLMGGALLQIGDYELDLSLSGRLQRFRARALAGKV